MQVGGQTPREVIAVGSSWCISSTKVSKSGIKSCRRISIAWVLGLAAASLTSHEMSEKGGLDHFDHGHKETVVHPDDIARHGDRALSLIGDERVTLTDEEVSSAF